jgi:hypothetical protein
MRKTIHILTIALVAFGFLPCGFLQAQEDTINILQKQIDKNTLDIKTLKKVKVSGYIQAQAEVGQRYAELKTGANNGNYSQARDGENSNFLRYGVRRGRIKIGYTDKMVSGLFEIDVNDAGVKQRNAYVQITEPWLGMFSLRTGLFVIFLGEEVCPPPSDFEGIELSMMSQKLFPEVKDVGAQLVFNGKKNTMLEGFRAHAGLLSGSALSKDDDSRLNFAAYVKYTHNFSRQYFGIGATFYNGTTNNTDTLFYTTNNGLWQPQRVDSNQKNRRRYYGIDAQYSFLNPLGQTNIRAEYMRGTQPSVVGDLKSPVGNTYLDTINFNHSRAFAGGYVYLSHYILHTPLALLLQYSYLDGNTKMKGNKATSPADLVYQSIGIGGIWCIEHDLTLTAMYNINNNETTPLIAHYNKDRNDNVFTLRLQYKF